ncbi:precorrin-6A synthase (deacetylating) [Nocardioides sp. DS6]|uniref:Precorrin-6A synthase (Deacetylating) n=1 Tax=Nocardioides eburneus TaxID=3231482 RepID=A0ABV3T4C1_9ACTN
MTLREAQQRNGAASPSTLRIIGIGMGPQHVTPEAAEALRGCDYVLAARKSADDALLAVRRAVAEAYDVELVAVPDPDRDRADPADYPRAVADWHEARVAAYAGILGARPGTVAMLVWGDPSLYDSSIRIADALVERGALASYDVLPGISAPQLLAARHRLVLNDVGRAVHLTTGRRLREAVDAGLDNLVVMLNRRLDLGGLEDWSIWWGGNLGAAGEELVSGRVGEVLPEIEAARERAREAAGWVMDLYLLRRP